MKIKSSEEQLEEENALRGTDIGSKHNLRPRTHCTARAPLMTTHSSVVTADQQKINPLLELFG